jgi:hypothetical protein
MVRSCSIIIYSVHVLYDALISEVAHKNRTIDLKEKELELYHVHAVVTEVEFMFLDIS